jgi:hypothetical protein
MVQKVGIGKEYGRADRWRPALPDPARIADDKSRNVRRTSRSHTLGSRDDEACLI